MNRIVIDTKTLIVNFMKENNTDYILVNRFLKLINFIFNELYFKQILDNYKICFDINSYSIKRVTEYNSDIFELDLSDEILYLCYGLNSIDLAKKYHLDKTISNIIANFVKENKYYDNDK